jgi:hypothetical protein
MLIHPYRRSEPRLLKTVDAEDDPDHPDASRETEAREQPRFRGGRQEDGPYEES